jgi:hemerythrin superfamily protein
MNAVQLLKQDHQEVAALFEDFKEAQDGEKSDIAEQICQMLTVHAQIEEELFYPAARDALDEQDEDLVDEAAVEEQGQNKRAPRAAPTRDADRKSTSDGRRTDDAAR